MATYINPNGSPSVTFAGATAFTQQQLADTCRTWGNRLHVPNGIDAARLLWAFAGKESSFGADCRPRHETAYCTGKYSKHADVVQATRQYGHLAHCSFGPWQMLYINDQRRLDPEVYGQLEYSAMATVDFLNAEIFGRQKASTLEQAADAWNSGNWRDAIVPADYIASVVHNYDNVPMPPAIDLRAAAGTDAYDLYHMLTDAIEGLGGGMHMDALVSVPVLIQVNGATRTLNGGDIRWISDTKGKHIESITLQV